MVHAPNRPPAGAPPIRINLYSDTQTRPTPAMKDAMDRLPDITTTKKAEKKGGKAKTKNAQASL